MNNYDEIISNGTEQNSFDKDAWIKKKQEDRQKAYELMDETAKDIVSDPTKFKNYLDVQARFDKYSVGNSLLITSQRPNATLIKDFSDWKELGAYIKKNEVGFIILEPGDSYQRANGTTSISYNPKKMFDVSQTTYKQMKKGITYDDKIKLVALLKDCPVNVKVVDDMNTSKIAEWNKSEGVLYVKRGIESKDVFRELAKELARASLEETGDINLDNFKCNATAYMICKKYDIDTSDFNFNYIPDSLKQKEAGEIRKELTSMRSTMEDINSRMNAHFENISKEPKNKDMER